MTEDGHLGGFVGEGGGEQFVGCDPCSHGLGVVTQLTDFGRCFVDEAEVAVGGPNGAAGEQGILGPLLHQLDVLGVVEIEAVMPHQKMDACTVAPSHLEAIERAQGLLDAHEGGDGGTGGLGAGHRCDFGCHAEAITFDGPGAVFGCDQRRVDGFQIGVFMAAIEQVLFDPCQTFGDRCDVGGHGGGEALVVQQRAQTCFAPKQLVDRTECVSRTAQSFGEIRRAGSGQCRLRVGEHLQDLVGRRCCPLGSTTGNGDDAAQRNRPPQ